LGASAPFGFFMSTLADLKTDVSDFLDRSDLTAKIPIFARLAQQSLERKWLPKFLGTTTTLAITGNQFLIPADSLGVRKVWLYYNNTLTKLIRKDELFVRANVSSTKYYWREDNDCFLRIAPAAGSTIRLRYIAKALILANDTDSNKWSLEAYDILFWATVLQASLYQQDEPSMAIAKQMLDSVLNDLIVFEISEDHTDLESAPGDYNG